MSETIIHPETGAILRRRKRMETVTYQGQSRTVEVEGWFPDDGGDGILVGADSKPLDDALAEMKCGWPGEPGVPLNPERDGWHWISLLGGKDNAQVIEWFSDAMRWDETDWTTDDFKLHTRYLGPCLTPAEVDARVKQARRDALEEAARRILIYFNNNHIAQNAAAAIRALDENSEFTFSSREKRGDKPCEAYDLLMKIAVARYGEEPQWTGPVAKSVMKHRTAQVQLMLDAIEQVFPDMATAVQYAVRLEQQLAESNFALAMIQQSIKDIIDGKERNK